MELASLSQSHIQQGGVVAVAFGFEKHAGAGHLINMDGFLSMTLD
jgi:hypothetical protein